MKANCKSFLFFITISLVRSILCPVKKITRNFERGKAAPSQIEKYLIPDSSGMMKRRIIKKLGMNEKKYALCLMLAGFAALNTGFTTQTDEIQSAETVEVVEVEQVPSEEAQIEEKSEVNENVQEETAEPVEIVEEAAEVVTVEPVEETAQDNSIESAERDYYSILSMEASAYLPSDGNGAGITATGIRAGYGVAAVDPSIIPLGTRLYIPGYGEAIAADTGGAIRGYMIDLCVESYSEAMQFGRRNVTVYVLNN